MMIFRFERWRRLYDAIVIRAQLSAIQQPG
jgi:hypothetical protein